MVIVMAYLGFMAVFLIYAIIELVKDGKKRKAYSEETGHKVSNKEWRAYKKQMRRAKKENQRARSIPVRTKILDHSNGDLVGQGGGLGRAVIGGAIAGGAGAIVGASTRKQRFKQKQYTMFRVWYQDGHDAVEKVEHGTAKYRKYLELIED